MLKIRWRGFGRTQYCNVHQIWYTNSQSTVLRKQWLPRRNQNTFKRLSEAFSAKWLLESEVNSEYCQTSKMELFLKIVKNEQLFTICAKGSILDVWQDSEYASKLASKLKDVSFLSRFEY